MFQKRRTDCGPFERFPSLGRRKLYKNTQQTLSRCKTSTSSRAIWRRPINRRNRSSVDVCTKRLECVLLVVSHLGCSTHRITLDIQPKSWRQNNVDVLCSMQPPVRNTRYSAYGVTHEANIQTSLQDGTASRSDISTTKSNFAAGKEKVCGAAWHDSGPLFPIKRFIQTKILRSLVPANI